jgi:hypothetical protein
MIAVAELRAGKGQSEEGVQELIVGEQLGKFSRKRIDPGGSLRWLRRLPCGWCQIPRTFPSGPSTNVTPLSRERQSPRFVAWLHRVAAAL